MSLSKVFIAYRGAADYSSSSAQDFSGTNYAARFSACETIVIRSVMFYGRKPDDDEDLDTHFGKKSIPSPKQKKPVILSLQISESPYYYPRKKEERLVKFLPNVIMEIDVKDSKRDDVFAVKLPKLVEIPKNVIFDIIFQLNGMDEQMSFHRLPSNKIFPKQLKVKGCDEKISVHMSSGQCAGFAFQVKKKESCSSITRSGAGGTGTSTPTPNQEVAETNKQQSLFDCFNACAFF